MVASCVHSCQGMTLLETTYYDMGNIKKRVPTVFELHIIPVLCTFAKMQHAGYIYLCIQRFVLCDALQQRNQSHICLNKGVKLAVYNLFSNW
jgi:hypothetical protein